MRRALRSIRITMKNMGYVLTLYALSVLIFTFLGWKLFKKLYVGLLIFIFKLVIIMAKFKEIELS